jgi:hypothetical protein
VLGAVVDDRLQGLNGLKTVLSFFANLVGVLILVGSGRVEQVCALLLLVTAYSAGVLGDRIAGRLRPRELLFAQSDFGVAVGTICW